jgi:uncharacterized protein (TIGR03435 family)
MTTKPENIDDVLKRALSSASAEEMECARDRIFDTLKTDDGAPVNHPLSKFEAPRTSRRWWLAIPAAAAIVLTVFMGAMWQRPSAVVERIDGSVSRLAFGETVRSDGTKGTTLRLADGSRVEMRSNSELVLEKAFDGVRIRLSHGSVIVDAAKQSAGHHLYVQTKDMTVSVVGTIFVVNAEEKGSRVAVIEGQIRVQQGGQIQSLLPGEQLSTNPKLETLPVKEEITWSQKAETHIALLEQAAPPVPVAQREAFEEAVIRRNPEADGGGGGPRGAGGGGGGRRCRVQIDPRRYAAQRTTVYGLISMAYMETNCLGGGDRLSGGPDWAKSDRYDIEALIPEGGSPVFTTRPITGVEARQPTARLRRMLKTLLEERFKLTLRRETREVPAYVLSVAPGGSKLTPWSEGDFANFGAVGWGLYPDVLNLPPKRNLSPQIVGNMNGNRASVAELASRLQVIVKRPVVDRTNIPGYFVYEFVFAPAEFFGSAVSERAVEYSVPVMSRPSLFEALREELGLELKPSTERIEFLTIERLERPSEN